MRRGLSLGRDRLWGGDHERDKEAVGTVWCCEFAEKEMRRACGDGSEGEGAFGAGKRAGGGEWARFGDLRGGGVGLGGPMEDGWVLELLRASRRRAKSVKVVW